MLSPGMDNERDRLITTSRAAADSTIAITRPTLL
jgi:hypothetical protein